MPDGVLTISDVEAAWRKVKAIQAVCPLTTIIEDINCTKESDERLFPASRHRSARIRKKLIKRFGGEFRRLPAGPYRTPFGIVCHPAVAARIRAEVPLRPVPSGAPIWAGPIWAGVLA